VTANPHPLDPATAAEYLAGREIMAAAGLLADPVRFAYYGLEEPPKDKVLAGGPADRRLRAFLLNLKTGESTDVVVSLTAGSVVGARAVDTPSTGTPGRATPSRATPSTGTAADARGRTPVRFVPERGEVTVSE
jgi:primary-amine oxidase